MNAITHNAVHIRNLTRRFGDRIVLDSVDLDIPTGEFVAMLGRSGSGKSTLLRALAEIDHEAEGSGQVQVPARRSVLFQDARLLPWAKVLDNVLLGAAGADKPARGRRALTEVGLGDHETDWPKTLSGGEQQRVALARSLVRDPQLLLADEPFSALDALTRLRMHALLAELCRRHRPTVLFVTHDVDEALALADRVLILDEGRIAVDQVIDLPQPRARASARFTRIRDDMLAFLGVGPEQPNIEPQTAASPYAHRA
jgi:sulfonate transport system ATP-binding protein